MSHLPESLELINIIKKIYIALTLKTEDTILKEDLYAFFISSELNGIVLNALNTLEKIK